MNLVAAGGGLTGVAVDEDGGFIYYSFYGGDQKIKRAKLDGSEETELCPGK